jgi:3-oxoacyl-[acyl-carrier protein] reductase
MGREIALRLAAAGVDVALGYVKRSDDVEQVAHTCEELGRRAIVISADLREPDAAPKLVECARRGLGDIDILIHNAGVGQRIDLQQLTPQVWDDTYAVHVKAAFLLAQATIPAMQRQRWGRIILQSSLAAHYGGVNGAHYASSKAAILGLMHFLAARYGRDGITVNAFATAFVVTEMTVGALSADEIDAYARALPVGRMAHPAEIAQLVEAYVRNSFVTGQTIVCDGGYRPS